MAFQQQGILVFDWEKQAQRGQEFIEALPTNDVLQYWTRLLRAVAVSGVVVVQYHHYQKQIALLASPWLLYDILLAWDGTSDAIPHPAIESKLAFWLENILPSEPMNTFNAEKSIGIRDRPSSRGQPGLAQRVRTLTCEGGMLVIQHRRRTYALLAPLVLVACFRRKTDTNAPWRLGALNWISELLSVEQPVQHDESTRRPSAQFAAMYQK